MTKLTREQIDTLTTVLKQNIEQYCVTAYDDGFRSHLGASLIGGDCARYMWYVFRWAFTEQYSGRMLRLFKRGHFEEARFLTYLNGAGLIACGHDPDTGNQFRVSAVNGHFGGSLDGKGWPANEEFTKAIGFEMPQMLLEFKTKGTGSGFVNMTKNGVKVENKQHYTQMCVYGYFNNLDYAIYMVVNKNDDDLHLEVVELDKTVAEAAIAKAETIVNSNIPPAKLSVNPAFFTCKFCNAVGVCHNNLPMVKNCRSCKYARPVENAEWLCEKYANNIPKDFLKTGCDSWQQLG
jgi:hypothetical protein